MEATAARPAEKTIASDPEIANSATMPIAGNDTAVAKPKSKRILYLDALIILAAFGVVAMHANGIVRNYTPGFDWAQALVVECLFYWAVPIFFMVTGINLMRYRERYDTKTFFIKRARRTLVPFLVWTLLIYVLYQVYIVGISIDDFSPASIYTAIFFSEHMPVYWFFIPLFSAYLAMPVLSLLKDNKRILWYIVGLGVLTFSVLTLVCELTSLDLNEEILFPLTGGGFLIFTILGYLLANTEIPKKWRILIYLAGLAGVAFRYIYTYIASTQEAVLVDSLFHYMYLPSVLLAVAVFVFFKQVDWQKLFRSNKIQGMLGKVSGCCLGIYLIHYIIIGAVYPLFGWTREMLITRTLGVVICFIVSLIIVWLLKKTPVLKHIVP